MRRMAYTPRCEPSIRNAPITNCQLLPYSAPGLPSDCNPLLYSDHARWSQGPSVSSVCARQGVVPCAAGDLPEGPPRRRHLLAWRRKPGTGFSPKTIEPIGTNQKP
jgi:hypothetical protein